MSLHNAQDSDAIAWAKAPTKVIDVNGVPFAYRELGPRGGVPVVFLHHFTAVMDDWDPECWTASLGTTM